MHDVDGLWEKAIENPGMPSGDALQVIGMDKQVENEEAREKLLQKMATENAEEYC